MVSSLNFWTSIKLIVRLSWIWKTLLWNTSHKNSHDNSAAIYLITDLRFFLNEQKNWMKSRVSGTFNYDEHLLSRAIKKLISASLMSVNKLLISLTISLMLLTVNPRFCLPRFYTMKLSLFISDIIAKSSQKLFVLLRREQRQG